MARGHAFPAKKRMTVWSNIIPRISLDGLSGTQSTGTALGASSAGGVTLVRTRGAGQYRFRPAAANDVHVVGLGLIVVNTDAFVSGGATSMPSPIDDVDANWVWHRLFQPAVATKAFDANDPGLVEWFEIDSKAMRIFKPNTTLAFIADGLAVSGSPLSDIAAAVRFLVKLG